MRTESEHAGARPTGVHTDVLLQSLTGLTLLNSSATPKVHLLQLSKSEACQALQHIRL